MERFKNKLGLLLLLSIASIFTISGCGSTDVNSKWRTQNLTIDGNDSDWGSSLTFYDKLNALIGVENDNQYLYLCLVTTDPQLQSKILRMGLTVWFDKTGNDDKKFGIKYPIGFAGMNKGNFRGERTNQQGEQPNSEGERPNMQQIDERIINRQNEMEFVGANNEVIRVPLAQLKGVELKLGLKDGRFVYEMKVPLTHLGGFDYALNADTGSVVSVGLETGAMNLNRGNGRGYNRSEGGEGGFEPPEGGMGGGDDFGGEGRPGGRGGFNRGQNFDRSSFEPLSFWAEVKLASEAGK